MYLQPLSQKPIIRVFQTAHGKNCLINNHRFYNTNLFRISNGSTGANNGQSLILVCVWFPKAQQE